MQAVNPYVDIGTVDKGPPVSDDPHSLVTKAIAIEHQRAERLRLALEQIAWMDEFLDADGAKAMMSIAREAINNDT